VPSPDTPAPAPERVEPPGTERPIVRVRGVSKTFGKDVRALDDVSLDVAPGIVYGLLGPNGAGKTTLIRVLATLLRPEGGDVEVAGVDVLADPTGARARIGLAGQFAAVDEYLTGRENVVMSSSPMPRPAGSGPTPAACVAASTSRRRWWDDRR